MQAASRTRTSFGDWPLDVREHCQSGPGSHATAPRRCRRGRSRSGRAAGPGLVVAYLTRAVFPHQGARLPLRSEREMRTLAESLDLRLIDAEVQSSGNGSSGGRRWTIARHLEVIPDARVSSSTPSLRATAVAAKRKLQKLRRKMDTTPASAIGRAQRPLQRRRSLAVAGQLQAGRSHEGRAFGEVQPEGVQEHAKEGQEQGQEPLRVQAERALPPADPPPPIRIVLGSGGELPPGSLYMERSFGLHGEPEGRGTPCRSHGTDAGSA